LIKSLTSIETLEKNQIIFNDSPAFVAHVAGPVVVVELGTSVGGSVAAVAAAA
jgi:hypothetical protein